MIETTMCERCGGVLGNVAIGNQRFCDCSALFRRAQKNLDKADPAGRMKLNTLSGPPQPIIDASYYVRNGKSLSLFGNPGTGKTHLTVAHCRRALEEGRLAGYYNVAELVGRIQSTFSNHEYGIESRSSIVEEVASHDLVVLDDLGKEHKSTNVESIIYELINALYMAGRQLIICSNLPPDGYRERYDDAVRSRIAGMCEGVVVEDADRRLG